MAAKPEKPSKRGCIARLLLLITAVSSLLLATALVFMVLPQDLSDLEGYGEGVQDSNVRNLTEVLRESVERGHSVTLSEEEINRWLGRTLKIKQEGLLAGQVKLVRLGVRLEEGQAEVVVERVLFGKRLTLSMVLQVVIESEGNTSTKQVVLHGGPILDAFPALKRGGRFGSLTVPQGYLYLVKPTFFQLGDVFEQELDLVFRKMHDIRLEEGRVVLKPRPDTAGAVSP